MGKILFKNKKVSFNKRGDKLSVKLRDANWNTIFEAEVGINDKKGMKELIMNLRNYGFDLRNIIKKQEGRGWFD